MSNRRVLTDEHMRSVARSIRDEHWQCMEKAAEHGTLWFCVWNKARRDEGPDEMRCGLICGLEIMAWFDQHPDWFVIGDWDDDRYARPVQLTDAGNQALQEREKYDMEPVHGGLVEPGWEAIPLPKEEVSAL